MPVHYDEADDVGRITIDGTDRLNKVDAELLAELDAALDRATEASCVILTGAGEEAFSAGGDLEYVSQLSVQEAYEYATLAHDVINRIERHPRPVIAAVNGYALGAGCQLVLGCDIRVMSSDAEIGQPEIGIGIVPGFGGSQRLPRIVGAERALRMVLLGEYLTATEAGEVGLVGDVVDPDELDERALEIATSIADKSAYTVSAAKEAIRLTEEMPLRAGLDYEKRLLSSLFGTPAQAEGMGAFLADRDPEFD